ncbi:MAG: mechanosensitive ion channel family protein [Balneolaceae bacterium]|nr:mechanosensitive ion channel family protein [Balneolaceae bacterium]
MQGPLKNLIPEEWLVFTLVVFTILGTIIIASTVNYLFTKAIKRTEDSDDDDDITNLKFLKRGVGVLIYITGIGVSIYMIPQLRVLATTMFAGAGVLAIAIGFASQQALANIIGGIFIVIFKPYKINDRIELRTTLSGVVEDINLRHTVIRNFLNQRIIIPNSVISNEILVNSNYEDDRITKWIEMGISYDSDIDLAKKIMKEEVAAHPLFIDARTDEQKEKGEPLVHVRVISMGESSVNLRAWANAKDSADAFVLGCDLLESIKKRFDKEGIEIPFPHRTIVEKKR